jgi:hypothetical protein
MWGAAAEIIKNLNKDEENPKWKPGIYDRGDRGTRLGILVHKAIGNSMLMI